MYHCEICFYMITEQNELFEILKQMPQFLRFSHEYQKSARADAALTSRADVILADMRQTRHKRLRFFFPIRGKRRN